MYFSKANNSSMSSLGTSALTMTPSPGPSGSSSQQRVRRSTRLYTNNNGSVKENEKSGGSSTKKAATPKSPRTSRKSSSAKNNKAATLTSEMNEKNLLDSLEAPVAPPPPALLLHNSHGVKEFLGVLGQIGQAYLHLAQYECRKAIDVLDRLSDRHYKTGWVLCAKGKAFYELSDYKMAVKLYEECRELEPSRLQGMEVLSTAYWYLENEVSRHNYVLSLVILSGT
jgi:anaphase-promoting complex subunit 3